MSATEFTAFTERTRAGTKIILSPDDSLCQERFATRACEIKAIQHWADKHGILLKSEFYFTPATSSSPASIVTYDYHPELALAPTPTIRPRWVKVDEEPSFN